MTTKTPTRSSKKLDSATLSRLALLAGAAAAIPLGARADGVVVYSGPENIAGDANSTNTFTSHTVDVDGNAASAFTFKAFYGSSNASVDVAPYPSGYAASTSTGYSDPVPQPYGQEIGSGSTFNTPIQGTLSYTDRSNPANDDYPWPVDGTPAYLGIEFTDNSPSAGSSANGIYYGWIQVGASSDDAIYNIVDWAYCNGGGAIGAGSTSGACVANAGPSAPEPNSLALLALGAVGVATVRARRRKARS